MFNGLAYNTKLVAMNALISPEIKEVIGAVHYLPSVSIIMPFEPKISLKTELMHSLKIAAGKVEKILLQHYSGEPAVKVINSLNALIQGLNFDTHKKGIALYVSPVFSKALYLDIPVEEKIIVDESFEIRDLVYCKKQAHKYLVLLLSNRESKILLGNNADFVRLASTSAETVVAYENDSPERIANFSDPSYRKEVILEKFLHHIDQSLDLILNAYHLPLFVVGTDRTIGHFKQLTKHAGAVVQYIHGNYEDATNAELNNLLGPYVADWKSVLQIDLLHRMEEAAGMKKLVYGMETVWKEAMQKRGKLLIVEKNYMFPALRTSQSSIEAKNDQNAEHGKYIKDAVDDVIEKVLENGGDVEFVDEGILKDFDHIALVLFY
jgi:hypothetical protein